jgi:hypothetical protein
MPLELVRLLLQTPGDDGQTAGIPLGAGAEVIALRKCHILHLVIKKAQHPCSTDRARILKEDSSLSLLVLLPRHLCELEPHTCALCAKFLQT